jgi:hypothetical protein
MTGCLPSLSSSRPRVLSRFVAVGPSSHQPNIFRASFRPFHFPPSFPPAFWFHSFPFHFAI